MITSLSILRKQISLPAGFIAHKLSPMMVKTNGLSKTGGIFRQEMADAP
jgi:hypothetical protein